MTLPSADDRLGRSPERRVEGPTDRARRARRRRPARLVRGHQAREDRHLPVLPVARRVPHAGADGERRRACTATWRSARSSATSPRRQVRFRVQERAAPRGRQRATRDARPLTAASRRRTCSRTAPRWWSKGACDGRRSLRRRQRDGEVPVEVRSQDGRARAALSPPPARRSPEPCPRSVSTRCGSRCSSRVGRHRSGRVAGGTGAQRVERGRASARCWATLRAHRDRDRRAVLLPRHLRLPLAYVAQHTRAQHDAALPAGGALGRPGAARCCSGSSCSLIYASRGGARDSQRHRADAVGLRGAARQRARSSWC